MAKGVGRLGEVEFVVRQIRGSNPGRGIFFVENPYG